MKLRDLTIEVARNWRHRHRRGNLLRRFLVKVLLPRVYRRNEGFYVLNQQWDNLIILDACRYDVFESVVEERGIGGALFKKVSRGTNTPTFLLQNFGGKLCSDIVYITGNPYVSKLVGHTFFKVIPVWKTDWDMANETVMPQAVYDHSVRAARDYPGKRLIIHFMQPHTPYVAHRTISLNREVPRRPPYLFARGDYKRMPSLEKRVLFTLHKENLLLSLPFAERLSKSLPGTTIITSDHGEALGEFIHPLIPLRLYGHLEGARIPSLVTVPWLVSKRQSSVKPIELGTSQVHESFEQKDEEIIEQRLKALGYE